MSLSDELYPASFRGVPFTFMSGGVSEGRNIVEHIYPFSSKIKDQDMGKTPSSFNMTAIIHGVGYLTRRDALRYVLNIPGAGILTHPFYGVLLVTAHSYTINETISDLGKAVFNLTFRVSSPDIFPVEARIALDIITDLVGSIGTSTAKDIKDIFHADRKYPNNTVSASNHLNKITNTFTSAINNNSTDIDKKNEFISNLNRFDNDKFLLIQSPEDLGTNLISLYDDFNNLGLSDDDLLNVNNLFFNFDFDEIPEKPLTIQRMERKTNSNIIKSVINALSLVYSYKAASDRTYKTEEEIDDIFASLEIQYEYLSEDQNISNETISIIEELRNSVRKIFDEERISAYKLTEISINDIPLSVLSYQYYGSTDNAESIMLLNNILTPAVASGDITIFSGGVDV